MQSANLLIDDLPISITVGGAEYPVNTDFRTAIRFAVMLQDRRIDETSKYFVAIRLFLGDVDIPDCAGAIREILDFYRGGKRGGKGNKGGGRSERVYDFEEDAGLIYAAYLEQYGIDLCETKYMHWWKFRALFDGLSDKTQLVKVIGYRTIEITDDMTAKQKKRYRELKRQYALADNRTEAEKEGDFARALLNM